MPDSDFQDGMSNVGRDFDNIPTRVGNEDEDGIGGGEEPIDEDSEGMSGSASTGNAGGADVLTVCYAGETYNFDSVSPDTVQTALLMLGYEVPSGILDVGSDPVNQQGTDVVPVGSDQQQRVVSLRMFRVDGLLETLCMQCGISSKSTMMLSGPDGPKTLCNTCGLQWATKETLTDFSKVSIRDIQEPSAKENEQNNEEAKESDASKNVGDKKGP